MTPAFTLIEMLLALLLVILLLGAIVFNFGNLARGAELDEGARRVESAFAFARAHAAQTQRPVRMVFERDEEADRREPIYNVRFLERPYDAEQDDNGSRPANPAGAGGVFSLGGSAGNNSTANNVEEQGGYRQIHAMRGPQARINDVVAVIAVSPLDQRGQVIDDPDLELASGAGLPPIEFYPDGSMESAEIGLVSRDPDDDRRVRVQIIGMTGRVTSRILREGEEDQQDADDRTDPQRQDEDPGFLIDR